MKRASHRGHRSGALTLLLVLVLVLLSVAATAALSAGNLAHREVVRAVRDTQQAEWLAHAGLHWSLWRIYSDPHWRTNLPVKPSGEWLAQPLAIDGGTFNVWGTDPDGSLSDDPSDIVELTIESSVQGNTVRLTAVLEPYPHPALDYAAFSTTDHLVLKNGVQVKAPLRGNADISGDATVAVDTSAGGRLETVLGANVSPPLSPYTRFVPHSLPALRFHFNWYAQQATTIGTNRIQKASLSSRTFIINGSPAGTPNPNGIYLVQANGADVQLRDVWIRGTLLIDDPKNVRIERGFRTMPRPGGYPVLIVRMRKSRVVTVAISRAALDEDQDGVDYNGDGELDSVIPSSIRGLVLVGGKLVLVPSVSLTVRGCLVARDLHVEGPVTLRRMSTQSNWKVPGTIGRGMAIRPGSLRRWP